jgi:hypothetical protein
MPPPGGEYHPGHSGSDMEWSTHCNTEVVRWILREHGVTLAGPSPEDLVDEVDPDVLRTKMREEAESSTPSNEGRSLGWNDWDPVKPGILEATLALTNTPSNEPLTTRVSPGVSPPASTRQDSGGLGGFGT